jgi:uncharacterized membrane protein required for colicin V production
VNYFDFITIGVLVVAFYSGYKNGLIKTVFRSVGYIAGGVFGLATAVNYLSTWQNQLHKVVLALLAILLGATLGEYLLGKVGAIFRVALFLPPFKFIDSLLGAVLSFLRAGFILYLLATLLVFSTWSTADEYIKPAKFYTYADSHLPSAMSEIKSKIIKLLKKVN